MLKNNLERLESGTEKLKKIQKLLQNQQNSLQKISSKFTHLIINSN